MGTGVRSAAVVAAGALLAAGAAVAAPPGEWRLVATRAVDFPVTYAGFLDARRGVTVGVHGRVTWTDDGGETFTDGRNLSDCRSALELLEDGFAWHAGTVQVNRSFNGGRTWYRVAPFQRDGMELARSLSFADENRGWLATDRRLVATEDGGLHWTPVRLPDAAAEVAAVSLALRPPRPDAHDPSPVQLEAPRPLVGRVLDRTGAIWRTDDGGASWRRAPSPLEGRAFAVAARAQTAHLRFTPAGEGAVAAFVEEAGRWRCRVWRIEGEGAGWAPEAVPLEELGTLFLSPDARVLTWKSADRDELRVYAR